MGELFLNEISIKEQNNTHDARTILSQLCLLLSKIENVKFRISESFFNVAFARDYTLQNWLNDGLVSKEEKDFLLTQMGKLPRFEDMLREIDASMIDVMIGKERGDALLLAWYNKGSLLSVPSQELWSKFLLPLQVQELDDSGFFEYEEEIKNLATEDHLENFNSELKKSMFMGLASGAELWLERKDLFPNLEFCGKAPEQLKLLNNGNPWFGQVVKKLVDLNNYIGSLSDGLFRPDTLLTKTSPESESRLNKFKTELTIVCKDGVTREFSWHSRFTPGAGRIHFAEDMENKKIHIGYIGKKLD